MDSKFVIFLSCVIFMVEPGVRGETESKGKPPVTCASAGIPGIPGVPGNPGRDGLAGPAGAKGDPGRPGKRGNVELVKSTWKQCVWKREDRKNTGLIQSCIFNKKYDNTSLRALYEGNLRTHGTHVCNRWYFTFDGAECAKPATIEGVVYVESTGKVDDLFRHRHIEGYCNQVPKGHVRVGFWIGKCSGYSLGDGHTGWNSMSRIVIEEIPPPQQ